MRRFIFFATLAVIGVLSPAQGQDLSALARVLPGQSEIRDTGAGAELRLGLSQGVPYRVFTLDEPRRLIIDFNEVDWAGFDPLTFDKSQSVAAVRTGLFQPGWSRMVIDLDAPLVMKTSTVDTADEGRATVILNLTMVDTLEFSDRAGAPARALNVPAGGMAAVDAPIRRQTGDRPLVVVLDPGHGGIDPGAEKGDIVEADLMLSFARELQEVLLRAGNFEVVLTRQADIFVPLESRVSIARAAQADVFLSLHADALAEGRASGATIYTLSELASNIASEKLAERHDRGDLLAGVDLSQQDDVIASVLMGLVRAETSPRSDSLAQALVTGLSNKVSMHKRPRLSAGFSVLKAPDIPSVLIELGFLSSKFDRENLADEDWRALAAEGIRDALQQWMVDDAAEALLLRQ